MEANLLYHFTLPDICLVTEQAGMQLSIAGQQVIYDSIKVTGGNTVGLPNLKSFHEVEDDDLCKSN